MVGTWQKKGNILGLCLLPGPPSGSEGLHPLAGERKDEATLPPTPARLGPPLFPAALRRSGRGRGTALGLEQHGLLWFGLGEKAGSQGKGRGCGELREGLAQLDFFRNPKATTKMEALKSILTRLET